MLPEADATIWVDAAHKVEPGVLSLFDYVGEAGIAVHRHPTRDCIYKEAVASMTMEKYQDQPILEQVSAYLDQGHPEHWGLWECGTIATVRGRIDHALDRWWEEIQAWSYQDQISFPYVMRTMNLWPNAFPTDQYHSPYVTPGPHNRFD